MNKSLTSFLSLLLLLTSAFASDETREIVSAARTYLRTQGVTGATQIEVQAVQENFARARVVPVEGQTDPAYLFLRKAGGAWKGVTLGTGFSDEDYATLKIPRALRVR